MAVRSSMQRQRGEAVVGMIVGIVVGRVVGRVVGIVVDVMDTV